MPTRAYAEAADALLAPFTTISNLLHISAAGEHKTLAFAHHARNRTRWSSASGIESLRSVLATSSMDVVVDDTSDALRAHFGTVWPALRPGGAFMFPLQPHIGDVMAWLNTLSERAGPHINGHAHHHYHGSRTRTHYLAAAEAKLRVSLPPFVGILFCAPSGCAVTKLGPCDCVGSQAALHGCARGRNGAEPASAARCTGLAQRMADTVTFTADGQAGKPVSDKIWMSSYQIIYGSLLTPYTRPAGRRLKMLEIGLGCDEAYGPGASVSLWQRHFTPVKLELWEGEFNAKCVARSIANGKLKGVGTVTGDQGNATVLRRWLDETHAVEPDQAFDIVIDDGGHQNTHTVTTFAHFWPVVRPGGMYFIEDLHVARMSHYEDTNGTNISTDLLRGWMEQLAGASAPMQLPGGRKDQSPQAASWYTKRPPFDGIRKLPEGTSFIACQTRTCALGKGPR
jgi:hypothetical protein